MKTGTKCSTPSGLASAAAAATLKVYTTATTLHTTPAGDHALVAVGSVDPAPSP